MVIHLLDAHLNVSSILIVLSEKLVRNISALILASELVEEMQDVKSSITVPDVSAQMDLKEMLLLIVLKGGRSHQLCHIIHVIHLLVDQTVAVSFQPIEQFVHVFQSTKEFLHTANLNVFQAQNVHQTELVRIRNVSILVLELVVSMQNALSSIIIQSAAVLLVSSVIHSCRANMLSLHLRLNVKKIHVIHHLAVLIRFVKSDATDQFAHVKKISSENLHTADLNVFSVQNVLRIKLVSKKNVSIHVKMRVQQTESVMSSTIPHTVAASEDMKAIHLLNAQRLLNCPSSTILAIRHLVVKTLNVQCITKHQNAHVFNHMLAIPTQLDVSLNVF